MKNKEKINVIGDLNVNDYARLKHDLGFYKGLFVGMVFASCLFIIFKFFMILFKI